MKSPFFSIVTPTFNRAHLLPELIKGVLSQGFADFEFVIVDDGSSDNTREVVEGFSDERIVYVHKENGERGAARNTGVQKSRGRYINFFDSDDVILPNHLQAAYDFIQKTEAKVFSCAYDIIDSDQKVHFVFLPAEKQLNALLLRKNLLSINALFFVREVCAQFPFEEDRRFRVGEDWLVWIRMAQQHTFLFHPVITSRVVQHDDRTMHIPSSQLLKESYALFHRYLDVSLSRSQLAAIRFEQLSLIAMSLALEKKRAGAFTLLLRCLYLRPAMLFSKRTLVVLAKISGLK